MDQISREVVEARLADIIDENTGVDLVSGGNVRDVQIRDGAVVLDLLMRYPCEEVRDGLAERVRQSLADVTGVSSVTVRVDWKAHSHRVQGDLKPLSTIRNIIAVASGKGGVGKSSTAVNLALALSRDGARVGILDADIYGPSIPRMLGASGQPETDGKRIAPKRAHGLQLMSIGFLIDEETPMIWRGPMVTSALQQLLTETDWDDLDYLVVDLPPGTGDIQLTLAQKVPVAGAVIVTTPQDIALLDARKALKMFEKVEIPVLGVVENMSTHVCSQCGHEEAIFGQGGGRRMADEYSVDVLGGIPLDMRIREDADSGRPTVVADPDGKVSANYREIARHVAGRLAARKRNYADVFPSIVVQNT